VTPHHALDRRRDDRGSAAVEFAIVLPVLLLVIFGILQYGYHYWALETASATAREAARRLAVGTDWTCTVSEAQAAASIPATGTVTVTRSSSTPTQGSLVTVTVAFPSLDVGLVPLPDDGRVSETATARVESVPATALSC
jgi:Flp pilus assembly protein TadG